MGLDPAQSPQKSTSYEEAKLVCDRWMDGVIDNRRLLSLFEYTRRSYLHHKS